MVEEQIKLTGDSSGLADLASKIEAAFNPKLLEEFNKTARGILDGITALAGQVDTIGKTGAAAFSGMTSEASSLRDALREVATANAEIASSQREAERNKDARRAQDRQDREERKREREEEKREREEEKAREREAQANRAFTGGLAQGLGIASYVPSDEPGQYRRIGGALLGAGIRRGVGGVAAPFLQPGIGGVASALSAIPWIGGALAGGLQTGAGFYGESVAFDQARLANLPFMTDVIGRARRGVAAGGSAFGGVWDAAENNPPPELGAANAALGDAFARQLADRRAGEEARAAMGEEAWAAAGEPSWTARAGKKIFDVLGVKAPAKTSAIDAAGATAEEKYSAVLDKISNQANTAQAKAFAAAFGPVELPGAGFGAGFGYGAGEVQQAYGQFMGARGGTGMALEGAGGFRETLAIQRLFGVGAQQQGGYARALQPGGGGQGGDIGQTIGLALAQGLSGSLMQEYLQQIAQHTGAMEQEGVKFNLRDYTAGAATMRAIGLEGQQAPRVGLGLQTGARALSAQGVTTPTQMLMMRAAGWTPESGTEGYFGAIEALEGGMDSATMGRFLGSAVSGIRGMGGGEAQQRVLMRRFMREAGVPIGAEQAKQILSGIGEGGELSPKAQAELDRIMKEGADISAPGYAGIAGAATGRVGGLAAQAAGLESQRIEAGRAFAPLMKASQEVSISLVNAMKPLLPQFTALEGVVKKAVNVFSDLLKVIPFN